MTRKWVVNSRGGNENHKFVVLKGEGKKDSFRPTTSPKGEGVFFRHLCGPRQRWEGNERAEREVTTSGSPLRHRNKAERDQE